MKVSVFFSIILLLFLILGCKNQKGLLIEDVGIRGNTIAISDLDMQKEKLVKNGNNITVAFVNNPVNLKENDVLFLYCDDKLIYAGNFRGYFDAFVPEDENGRIIHFALKIAKVEDNGKEVTFYNVQNKSICVWDSEFKYLYVAFFPTNEEPDKVNFFPQRNTVIQ